MDPRTQGAPPRRRLLLGGKIVFNNRNSVFDCTVRAMSDQTAELRMQSTLGVPDVFQLRIDLTGQTRLCQVDWRTETDIGATLL